MRQPSICRFSVCPFSILLAWLAVGAVLPLVRPGLLFGDPLLYEPFGYSVAGGTSLNGKSGGGESGLAGAWATNVTLGSDAFGVTKADISLADPAVSLSHPLLWANPTGGRLDDSDGGNSLRGLDGFTINMGTNDVRYVSALVRGSAMIQFQGYPTGTQYIRSAFGIDNSGEFLIGMNNESGKYASGAAYSRGTYQTDQAYLLVAKIAPTSGGGYTDAWSLKVFDRHMTPIEEPSTWDYQQTQLSGVNLDKLSVGFYSGIPGQVDEIRVGESWVDVVETPTAVVEDFLYGAADGALHGEDGGQRWGAAWNEPGATTPPTDPYVQYHADTNLQFDNPDYGWNGMNAEGAIANSRSSDFNDVIHSARREFDKPLDGTVWISGLVRAANDQGSVLLWLEPNTSGSSGANAIGFFEHGSSDNVWIKYNGAASFESNPFHDQMDEEHTYLYLAKLDMNYSAEGYDRIAYWIKQETDDVSSELALGSPLFSREGADALGPTFDYLGLSFNRTDAYFDALRVGSTFNFVMGVPEPSSLVLGVMALALLAVSSGRRSRCEKPLGSSCS